MKQILKEYEVCFGQCINYEISILWFSPNAFKGNQIQVSSLLGFDNLMR